jgi:hypothetical protein
MAGVARRPKIVRRINILFIAVISSISFSDEFVLVSLQGLLACSAGLIKVRHNSVASQLERNENDDDENVDTAALRAMVRVPSYAEDENEDMRSVQARVLSEGCSNNSGCSAFSGNASLSEDKSFSINCSTPAPCVALVT